MDAAETCVHPSKLNREASVDGAADEKGSAYDKERGKKTRNVLPLPFMVSTEITPPSR